MLRQSLPGTALATAVIASVMAFLAAGLLWLFAVGSAQGLWCPKEAREHTLTGLDTARSAWPPGAVCTVKLPSGERVRSVEQVFDGAATAIGVLAGLGVAFLTLGIGVSIHRMRTDAGPFARPPGRREPRAGRRHPEPTR